MAKQRRRRRSLVQAGGRQDMYVLAGLPIATQRRAVIFLQARLPEAFVQAAPSPTRDGALYSDQLLDTQIRAVGEFAVRRRTNGPKQPAAPATITLLYVPSADAERLLTAFDFAVMAAPLTSLICYDERGRQLRHDLKAVEEALLAATDRAGEVCEALNHVVRRLAYQSSDEALLLPPRNFLVGEGNLTTIFRVFRLGGRPWTDRLTELGPAELTHEDMPRRIDSNQTKRIFVDDRGMAFPIAHPMAYDGAARELNADEGEGAITSSLRTLYRFGGAVARGLHHDAQRSDGTALGGAVFHCDREGEIHPTSRYANVFPNDFVRVR